MSLYTGQSVLTQDKHSTYTGQSFCLHTNHP